MEEKREGGLNQEQTKRPLEAMVASAAGVIRFVDLSAPRFTYVVGQVDDEDIPQ